MVVLIYFESYIDPTTGEQRWKKRCRPCRSREDLLKACNSEENRRNWELYQQTGDKKHKMRLVEAAFNIQALDGQLLDEVEAASPFAFHDIDCYDRQEHDRIVSQLLARREELGIEGVADSASGGIHVVLRRQPGQTLLEAQVNLATQLQVEMDTQNADWHRICLCGPITPETTPLLSDTLFTLELPADEAQAEYRRMEERKAKGEEQVPPGAKRANKHYRPWEDTVAATAVAGGYAADTTAAASIEVGEPTESALHTFYDAMRHEGAVERDLQVVGTIHTTVKNILSFASPLMAKTDFLACLKKVTPTYWNDANISRLVDDFYANYNNPSRPLTREQKRVFLATKDMGQAATTVDAEPKTAPRGDTAPLAEIYASPLPPQMPTSLPPVLKDILKPVPRVMRPTVSMKVFPVMGAYPKEFSCTYIDGQPREPRLNCHTVGPSGDGKDSSARGVLGVLTKRMRERSRQARIEIRAFNEAYNAKAANREKPHREDFVHSKVQFIKSDITRARLNQTAQEADGITLYCEMNELSKLEQLEGRFGSRCHYDIVNTADDEQNDFGQDRAGNQSVISDCCLRLNYCVNSTYEKCHKLLDHVVHEGPVGRMTFNTTPLLPIGTRLKYGSFGADYEASVAPYLDALEAATGHHECKPACRLIERLDDELADYCSKNDDPLLYKQLGRRALVACFRRAIVLWAASGMKWSRSFEGWLRWSLHWDIFIKLSVFEPQLRPSEQEPAKRRRGPASLLDQLPDPFSLQDAVRVRLQNGKDEQGTQNMLAQWQCRKYILRMTDDSFKKTRPDSTPAPQ